MKLTTTSPAQPPTLGGSETLVLLTTKEAAALLRCAPLTLEIDRCRRRWGVPFLKVGRSVRYDRAAVLRWLAERNPQMMEG